jgi:transcriptional regulator with XRE-family HTH domain
MDFAFRIIDFSLLQMSLGEKISTLRKSKGMSQEMLAEHSRLSLRTVQRIESDETSPRPYTLRAMAAALNVSIEDFATHSGQSDMDRQPLKIINLAALSVMLIPILHLLVVALIWRWFNTKRAVHPAGKRIISFQVLWVIGTLILAILAHVIQRAAIQSVAIGQLPPTMGIVYGIMLLVNVGLTLRTALQLQQDQQAIYPFVPALF